MTYICEINIRKENYRPEHRLQVEDRTDGDLYRVLFP